MNNRTITNMTTVIKKTELIPQFHLFLNRKQIIHLKKNNLELMV